MRLLAALLYTALALTAPAPAQSGRLSDAASPYLRDHAANPVDWHAWGPEALARARTENKPIFVSVGYAACHWCHVMEDESFSDPAIAALLNAHFIAIKIDRESRPDLDEQLMFATQLLTGTGGWPNSVFLTPGGDPFFAGGYWPREDFARVLMAVHGAWQEDGATIALQAGEVSRAVTGFMAQSAPARQITPALLARATGEVIAALDPFSGGYGTAPKFPRESLFLFLIDHAERTGDRRARDAVTAMLDGMIAGGIHDQAGGGFHRYAVDPEWQIPHFEKMLYTQALTGRLLLRAFTATGAPRYRHAAQRSFDYVLTHLTAPDGAFFASQDADSTAASGEREEGAYYTWTLEELAPLGAEDARRVADLFGVAAHGPLEGRSVLHLAQARAVDAETDALLARLLALREARPAPRIDRKVVLSWNALMIATLAEAGSTLDRPDYAEAARRAMRALLARLETDDELMRISFEDIAEIPAQLPDRAALGLAMLALHDTEPNRARAQEWLEKARLQAEAIGREFGEAGAGYRMTRDDHALGAMIPLDDTEIPSGNALALSLFARLDHRAQVPDLARKARLLAAALSGPAAEIPDQRGYGLMAIREMAGGETGPLRFGAHGAVRGAFRREGDRVALALSIAPGWHVNAHAPLEDWLIATEFSVDGAEPVAYPPAVLRTLGFAEAPLALYEGDLVLSAGLASAQEGARAGPRRAVLTFQACNDEICLDPESFTFTLW